MNLTKKIFLIVFTFLVGVSFSCKKESKKTINKELTKESILILNDTINFTIPDSIPSPFSRSNLFWNSNEKYVGFLGDQNGNEIKIHVLNIENGFWFNVKLLTEGPNQVYGMGSFTFNDDDTLTYFPVITPKILKINFQGEVLSSYEYSDKYKHAINNAVFKPDILLDNSSVGFLTMEFLDMDEISSYDKAKLYTIFEFKNEKAKHIIKHPEEFLDNAWSSNDRGMTAVYNNDKIILNFSKSHFVYSYDLQGNLIEKINVKVKGIGDATPLNKSKSGDAMAVMLKTEATGKYSSLIYDKWKRVYYRIGTFYDSPLFEPKDFKELTAMRNKLTYVIVTLDEDFGVIGTDYFNHLETNLNNGSYFVNENGLYLNMINRNNENLISYVQIVLNK